MYTFYYMELYYSYKLFDENILIYQITSVIYFNFKLLLLVC